MSDLFAAEPPPLREIIAELDRELVQRRRVFPRLVSRGTLTQDRADRQMLLMKAARDRLAQLAP